jgi:hypothetical protein
VFWLSELNPRTFPIKIVNVFLHLFSVCYISSPSEFPDLMTGNIVHCNLYQSYKFFSIQFCTSAEY